MSDEITNENIVDPEGTADASVSPRASADVGEQRRAAALRKVAGDASPDDRERLARATTPENRSAKRVVTTEQSE